MCGFSALVNKDKSPVSESEIRSMNGKIIHRGPDSEGYYLNEYLAFGFRRLSIIDLSSNANQPMSYGDDLVIVFNGEIFNYLEIKRELLDLGYQFKTTSDTEVILASYQEWGEACTLKFNGMWALVIHDKKRNILFCSRDRYGIKPLVYHINENQIILASEIKQVLEIGSYHPALNHDVAFRFLSFGILNDSDETFFKGILNLTPGHNLSIDLSTFVVSKSSYFDIREVKTENNLKYNDAVIRFKSLFFNAVKIRLRSDVTVGSFLSGGLDSSSIISTAKKLDDLNLSAVTYSSCYEDKKYDEQEYIDAVITDLDLHSKKIFPNLDELLELDYLGKMSYYHDQPILTPSFFNEFKLFEAAGKDKLKVMLDGQGSDEFMAGYMDFNIFNTSDFLKFRFLKLMNDLKGQKRNHKVDIFTAITNILRQLKNIFTKERVLSLPSWVNSNFEFKGLAPYSKVFPRYRDLSVDQIMYSSIPHQLHAQDRSAMAHSVESRNPFLDFDLTEFIFSLPDDFKLNGGCTKKILRDAMKGVVSPSILNRHSKMGFVAPEPYFMIKNKQEIKKILVDAVDVNKMLLNKSVISDFESCNSPENYNSAYFRIISFYVFQKQFNLFS